MSDDPQAPPCTLIVQPPVCVLVAKADDGRILASMRLSGDSASGPVHGDREVGLRL